MALDVTSKVIRRPAQPRPPRPPMTVPVEPRPGRWS
jgi:hypothetical protein